MRARSSVTTRFSRKQFRHVAARNLLRQTLRNRCLAHTGFTDENRIVLGSPAQHLDHALDFVVAADHRIEFPLLGELGQVAAKRPQRRCLDILLRGRLTRFGLGFRRREIWIELLQNLVARPLDIDFQAL